MPLLCSACLSILLVANSVLGGPLESGRYFISQTWSQEAEFERPYLVHVPVRAESDVLPLFIVLHGNGGSATGAMQGFLRRNPTIKNRYILVFPQGYLKSWNIVSEKSRADDRRFIEAIIESLSAFDNVRNENISIMGISNGAALVNQLAIECRIPGIRNYVTSVSPLNAFQHDGENFRAKGRDNEYETVATPLRGKRIMNISGTEDRLVPYRGGPSRVIPAKGGKLEFVAAEESIFLWARAMGYRGEKLSQPTESRGRIEIFSYLDGDVVHYKVAGEGHGATRAIDEKILLEFLDR